MKRGLKKILSLMPQFVQDFVEMIFDGSAEYHIKVSKSGKQKYTSYTQLKRHQKNVRRGVALVLLVIVSWLGGLLVAPIFFPQPAEPEVYIPNGKGDILVSNVSRNQATVIFKTLDSANGNIPLATKAVVEFYNDENYTDLERRTSEDDYAVTHIVPIDSLQEGKIYYIRIIAKDSAIPAHEASVSHWGESERIKVFTTGELIPTCAIKNDVKTNVEKPMENVAVNISDIDENIEKIENVQDESLRIDDVQNENYLQPQNKVQTIISWTTNLPSTTVITYGQEKTGEKMMLDISKELDTKHVVVLTTLKPSSVYYFSVESKDANGNVVTSDEYSLRTPRAQENVVQKITNNFKDLLLQIKPR